jgi:hypothetical protein
LLLTATLFPATALLSTLFFALALLAFAFRSLAISLLTALLSWFVRIAFCFHITFLFIANF